MALGFDISRRPRRPADWEQLLEAIYVAEPTDESLGLEWKGQADLTDRNDVGRLVAREILAFANRPVAAATAYFEGHGVLVIGLAPGQSNPPAQLDSSDLGPKISAFIGEADGPAWDLRYVTFRGEQILVIDVAPPTRGDRIYALRKPILTPDGKTAHQIGTVFVRHTANADLAKQADFDALISRAQPQARPELDITVTAEPAIVNCWSLEPTRIDFWLDVQRQTLLDSIDDAHRAAVEYARRHFDPQRVAFASMQRWVDEDRNEDAFRAEVERWLARVKERIEALPKTYGPVLGIAPAFLARNDTDEHIKSLRIILTMRDAKAWQKQDEAPDLHDLLPKPPRPYGGYYRSALGNGALAAMAAAQFRVPLAPVNSVGRRVTKLTHGDPVVIEPPIRDLRAHDQQVFGTDTVIFVSAHRAEDLVLRWTADAENLRGRVSGAIPVSIAAPLDLLSTFSRDFAAIDWT